MSSSKNETSKDLAFSQKDFFMHFYSDTATPVAIWRPLKQKYKYYKQQSYNTSKHSSEISFIKKFTEIFNYLPFVSQIRTQKIEIPLIQQTIQAIYNDHQAFFVDEGWRVVKNKSLKARIQQYLLLKLAQIYSTQKMQGGLDNLVLGFFYTLNYYKTCNYQIRLFNDFLYNAELQSFFVFILLRKRSRRVNKDLSIKSEYISAFVQVLKGQRNFPALGSYSSEHEQMGEVKLLLIYPEIMQYINNNGVVLHQALLYSLMRCAGLTCSDITYEEEGSKIDWSQFLLLYFQHSAQSMQRSYHQQFIKKVVSANLKIADCLFQLSESNVTFDEDKLQPRQKFLQESFGWLIGILQNIIIGKQGFNSKLRNMYLQLQQLYSYNLTLGNKLVQSILKSEDYHAIYKKYAKK